MTPAERRQIEDLRAKFAEGVKEMNRLIALNAALAADRETLRAQVRGLGAEPKA
jgi:hypothetical protein